VYVKLFRLASKIAEEFRNDTSPESYIKPKAYQLYVACDIAQNILKLKRVRMTLGAGQGKTIVFLLVAMILQ
jgi:hypothetical protein